MGHYKHFLPLVLLLGLSGNEAADISVNGTLGKSVLLSANVPAPETSVITWTIGIVQVAQSVASFPQCLNQFVGRCELYINGSLRLDNVSYSDEGTYILSVRPTTSSVVTATNYQLRVYAPLSPPVLRTNITKTPLTNGTDVSFQCDAGNQNVTSYTFSRDGQKIICSEPRVICRGSFLDFTPISENDSGSYNCTIENPISSSTSNSLNVTVYVPVSNITVTSNVSGLVWPGLDSVSLRCSARGTNVSYSWSLQGAPISAGGRYILTDNNTVLIISTVSSTTDNGSFVCTATNLINSQHSSDMKLNLASPVSEVALTSNTSAVLWAGEDSASFHCSAQGSAITFSWRLNGNQISKPPYYITQSDSPPNSNLTISPVSRQDTGPFTCTASNRANNITSTAANLTINWSPDGNISCTAQSINQIVQLGCSWPGGKPAANVTMIFGDVQNTSTNEVFRNVSSSSNIHGSSLTCNGIQRRNSSCVVTFDPPKAPDHKNDTVTPGVVGGAVNLTVDLQPGAQSRATTLSAQALPATFSWFQGNSSTPIQNGGKFKVDFTSYASTLNIDKLTEADSGDYKCVAENFIGKTTFLFNVKVSQSAGGSSSGLDGGAIAGIVIGVLAGVAIIGIIAFFIIKKKKRGSEDGRIKGPENEIGTAQYAVVHKEKKTNGGMAETEISNPPQSAKDEVNYAALQFPNNPSTKAAAPAKKEETIYSDVKNSTKT